MAVKTSFYDRIPDWVKVGLWIGFSAGITAVCSYILEQPELVKYYGVVNFVLFAIKEIDKKWRRGEK